MIGEFLSFYRLPMAAGAVCGAMLSWLGVFVVIRKNVFFGITLSQASAFSVLVTLIAGIHGEIFILLLSLFLMMPFYFSGRKRTGSADAVYAAGFVFFTAMQHLLTAFGGGVSSHLSRAFFGDILTVTEEEWIHLFLPTLAVIPVFFYFLPYFKLSAFDPDEASIHKISSEKSDFIFFLMLAYLLGVSIKLFGSIFSMAHLIIPAAALLSTAKSIRNVLLYGSLLSVFATAAGFLASFFPVTLDSEEIYLPTTTAIVAILAAGAFFIRTFHRFTEK